MEHTAPADKPEPEPEPQPQEENGDKLVTSDPKVNTNGGIDAGSKTVPAENLSGEVEPDENDNAVENTETNDLSVGMAPKKKRSRKPKSQKAKKAGTGFEEYFVDAPITPAEFNEERGLYDSSVPFVQRIETAIQRFAKKRNMDSARKNVFDKYLRHGGVDSGPKQFSGGLDARALEDNDAAGIAQLTATHYVSIDPADPRQKDFVVDFEGCLKGFFSHKVPTHFDIGKDVELQHADEIQRIVGVIRNFLNYLIYHDVCTEYQDQIQASKQLCDQAERELWATELVKSGFPGDFNRACSQVFGGIYAESPSNSPEGSWTPEIASQSHGLSQGKALQIFKTGLVANANTETFSNFRAQATTKSIHVVKTEDTALEVTEIIMSKAEAQAIYGRKEAEGLKPVGILKAKTWHSPFLPQEDLTEEEEEQLASVALEHKEYEFWVEDETLKHCFVRMKFDATVRYLSIGITYFDAVDGVYCSFFDISANEMMDGWREPEKEWLPRRATGGGPLVEEEVRSSHGVEGLTVSD